MNVLGIETSCDETGVALYSTDTGLVADVLHSQVDLHAMYGGVVPEIASRDHIRCLLPLIEQVLQQAGIERPDAIAYTPGPGLGGAAPLGHYHRIRFGLSAPVVRGSRPAQHFTRRRGRHHLLELDHRRADHGFDLFSLSALLESSSKSAETFP